MGILGRRALFQRQVGEQDCRIVVGRRVFGTPRHDETDGCGDGGVTFFGPKAQLGLHLLRQLRNRYIQLFINKINAIKPKLLPSPECKNLLLERPEKTEVHVPVRQLQDDLVGQAV